MFYYFWFRDQMFVAKPFLFAWWLVLSKRIHDVVLSVICLPSCIFKTVKSSPISLYQYEDDRPRNFFNINMVTKCSYCNTKMSLLSTSTAKKSWGRSLHATHISWLWLRATLQFFIIIYPPPPLPIPQINYCLRRKWRQSNKPNELT